MAYTASEHLEGVTTTQKFSVSDSGSQSVLKFKGATFPGVSLAPRWFVQDAYIRALKGFHLFRGGNSRGWFLTIVRNTAYTSLNRRAVAEEKLIPYEEEKYGNIISIDDPDNELPTEAQKEYLQKALERLPLEFREVIILYELEGLSYKELASTLGIPVGTVMSRQQQSVELRTAVPLERLSQPLIEQLSATRERLGAQTVDHGDRRNNDALAVPTLYWFAGQDRSTTREARGIRRS
jgi:RNA polymerase sigma-70 factor (ECF subfamily)